MKMKEIAFFDTTEDFEKGYKLYLKKEPPKLQQKN
jgi:hypothetical protein